jgi:hypothetical protein
MAFYTSNTERMRISSSGDVLVGTTTAIGKFGVLTPTSGYSLAMQGRSTDGQSILSSMDRSGTVYTGNLGFLEDGSIVFGRLNTGSQVEACRTDSSGNLLVGTTSASGVGLTLGNQAANSGVPYAVFKKSLSGTVLVQYFYHNATGVGSIQCSDTATSYVTLSDYRLKKDIAPMTGALAKVLQLKPVTYKWKSNGSDGEGFIAHELAEICPHAVAGEKDAVDADKNIVSQGIDTSFLVATLTAAIQELKAINDSLTLRIVALESK